MASTQISLSLPQDIDVLNVPVAFGRRLVPQLNERLKSQNLEIRQKALAVLGDYVHSADYAYQAINAGCVETLFQLLNDEDPYVRYKSTDLIVSLASHSVGRLRLMKKSSIGKIAKLLKDPADAVRFASSHALAKIADTHKGAQAIVNAGIVKLLVYRIWGERKEIQYQLMSALHICSRIVPEAVISYQITPLIVALLGSSEPQIREICARLLLDIGICLKGKQLEVKKPTLLKRLVKFLSDNDPGVCAAATSTLMNIAVTTPGKYALLKFEAVPPLVKLLSSEFSDITLYATKALTLVAETPEGRALLKKTLTSLNSVNWKDSIDPTILGMDSLPNKRAKYIIKNVIQKEV